MGSTAHLSARGSIPAARLLQRSCCGGCGCGGECLRRRHPALRSRPELRGRGDRARLHHRRHRPRPAQRRLDAGASVLRRVMPLCHFSRSLAESHDDQPLHPPRRTLGTHTHRCVGWSGVHPFGLLPSLPLSRSSSSARRPVLCRWRRPGRRLGHSGPRRRRQRPAGALGSGNEAALQESQGRGDIRPCPDSRVQRRGAGGCQACVVCMRLLRRARGRCAALERDAQPCAKEEGAARMPVGRRRDKSVCAFSGLGVFASAPSAGPRCSPAPPPRPCTAARTGRARERGASCPQTEPRLAVLRGEQPVAIRCVGERHQQLRALQTREAVV